MTRPRQLPDDDRKLEKEIVRDGQVAVADRYGVTRQAVSLAVRDRKLNVPRRVSYKEHIPWKISQAHQWVYEHEMLRFHARREMGLPAQKPGETDRLDAWKAELSRLGVVVHYTTETGFVYTPARDGDTGVIRVPDHE